MKPSITLYNVSNRRSVREPMPTPRQNIESLIALNNGITKHSIIRASTNNILLTSPLAGSADPAR